MARNASDGPSPVRRLVSRTGGANWHNPDNWREIAVKFILWEQQVKRLCFVAEPGDCFNLKGDWVVMAHNLDDAGDVEQVGGPFPTETEAEAEVERLERSPH